MQKNITVRGLKIGEGAPKIIVPIIGRTRDEIIEKATCFRELKIDVVEWRVDFFEDVFETEKVLETLKILRSQLPDMPLLFTFRTKKEGGEKEISMPDYTALNKAVVETGLIDFVDVEIFSGDSIVAENIENIHRAGSLVVGSNHDFYKTPEKTEIVSRLRKMQEMKADLPKIAVMPQSFEDVLILMGATYEMSSKYADRPIVTMSMSSCGVISRLVGEAYGSAMTFGAVGQGSAPGQIPAEQLVTALEILHQAI